MCVGKYLSEVAIAIDAKNRSDEKTLQNLIYPDIDAGLEGIRWIEMVCVQQKMVQCGWILCSSK